MWVRWHIVWLLVVWGFADVVVLIQCSEDPMAHIEFLTAWSHIASLIAHYPILFYLCWFGRDQSYRRTAAVYIFCASGVLLAAILVTFFVVVLIGDELFSERVDVTTMGHYKHLIASGQLIAFDEPVDNSLYFQKHDFAEFATIGIMVTYNNIRHVLPAVLHLLITLETPSIRSELSSCSAVGIALLAVVLPLTHCYFHGVEGEESLYKVPPVIPAVTMGVSVAIASFYYQSLGYTVPQNQYGKQLELPLGTNLYSNKFTCTPLIRV